MTTVVTVSLNDNIVAMVSGTRFTGPVSASAGLSGSLQQVGPGLPYLLTQGGITITTQSNGQIIISGSGGGGGSNPTAGTGIVVNGSQVSINDNVVATLSGSIFSGPVSASAGLSGSLQRVGPNLSYLVASEGMTVTSQSNGQIILASRRRLLEGAQLGDANISLTCYSGSRFTMPTNTLSTTRTITLSTGSASGTTPTGRVMVFDILSQSAGSVVFVDGGLSGSTIFTVISGSAHRVAFRMATDNWVFGSFADVETT